MATKPVPMQKLYLLLPNHKCPNKKGCPFHPPEELEDEDEEAEIFLVNKRRSNSVEADREISQEKLAAKLASINSEINSRLLDAHKLHMPRKTSHDISITSTELHELTVIRDTTESMYETSTEASETEITIPLNSTREESVASDYDYGSTLTLDSGVMFDSWSDAEYMEEEPLPLIEEELDVADVSFVEDLTNVEEKLLPLMEEEIAIPEVSVVEDLKSIEMHKDDNIM